MSPSLLTQDQPHVVSLRALSAKEHLACRFIKSSVGELVVLLSKICSQISGFQVVHHLSRKPSRGKKPMPKFDSLIWKIQKILLSLGWVCYQFLLVSFFKLKYFNLGSGMLQDGKSGAGGVDFFFNLIIAKSLKKKSQLFFTFYQYSRRLSSMLVLCSPSPPFFLFLFCFPSR